MQTERDGAGPRLALHDDAFLSDVARPPTPTHGEIGEITDEASASSAENDAASSVSVRIKSLGSSAADRIRSLVSEWRAAVEAKRDAALLLAAQRLVELTAREASDFLCSADALLWIVNARLQ